MKKFVLLVTALVMGVSMAFAIPAHPKKVTVKQPDGTAVTLWLHGDEYLHYTTTGDGYSVVQNSNGYYVYAQLDKGQLVETVQVAHDNEGRSNSEKAFLAGVPKNLKPEMKPAVAQERQKELARQAKARAIRRAGQYDYTNFRGLLILVQFTDKSFSRSDYASIVNDMVNKENYTGYQDTRGRTVTFTGSVRDYFNDSSNGKFHPQFDIIGPVTVDYSQYDPKGTDYAWDILASAILEADPLVDFSQYDRDNDGYVDLVYFIVAGNGANYSGNNSDLFWPHRSGFYGYVSADGVRLGDYASSVELQGYTQYPSTVSLDGIGTICHEFSHVLGLPDFYDTDYESGGGESAHPSEWSLMAGGSYLNNSKTPCSYSLYEKYSVGFIGDEDVQKIDATGSYTLQSISSSHKGLRLDTPQNKEYFMLENRQNTKWDEYLPGHGMLVFRVDETSSSVWNNNKVNANPSHNYYEMVRAGGVTTSSARASDPFPGSAMVTSLDNTTSPANLLSWAGKKNNFGLNNIREQNGVIYFDVLNADILNGVNLPQEMEVPLGLKKTMPVEIIPDYAPHSLTWESSDPSVATVDQDGKINALSVGSTIITVTDVSGLSAQCQLTVFQPVVADNIAEFKQLDQYDEAMLNLQDAQVLYVGKKDGVEDAYVRDATGSIVFRDLGLSLERNNVLNGSIYAKRSVDNRMPLLISIDELTTDENLTVTVGEDAQPRPVQLSALTDDDLADLVTLQTVELVIEKEGRNSYAMAKEGDVKVFINNRFSISGLTIPDGYETKRFDIAGIYATRMFELAGTAYDDIYPIKPMEESEIIEPVLCTYNYQIGEGGSVIYDNTELRLDGQFFVNEGESFTLSVLPDVDYELSSVLLDATDVTDMFVDGGVVTVTSEEGEHTLSVTFKSVETGITAVSAIDDNNIEVYNIDGSRIATATKPGIYLVKKGNRIVKKLIVK